jgi:hypothetical protein
MKAVTDMRQTISGAAAAYHPHLEHCQSTPHFAAVT